MQVTLHRLRPPAQGALSLHPQGSRPQSACRACAVRGGVRPPACTAPTATRRPRWLNQATTPPTAARGATPMARGGVMARRRHRAPDLRTPGSDAAICLNQLGRTWRRLAKQESSRLCTDESGPEAEQVLHVSRQEQGREERDQTDKHRLLLQDVRGRREREEAGRHRGRTSLSQGDRMGLRRKEGLHKMRMGVGQGLAGQPISEQMLRIACQPRRSL